MLGEKKFVIIIQHDDNDEKKANDYDREFH